MKRECGTAKTDEYTLVKSIEKLVNNQEQELELAVLDKGEYQLRPELHHLLVAGDKWTNMTNDQRKAALSCVHHIGLEDSSPNSVATIKHKVSGRRVCSVPADTFCRSWLDNFVLKFIAHKAEGLISEYADGKVECQDCQGYSGCVLLVHSCSPCVIKTRNPFTNTYYHPNPTHIRRKTPVFDGRVLIKLGTYQSLDEGQKEMLNEHGLFVYIVNS